MINKINELLAQINNLKANSLEELEAIRIQYLSKKGEISSLMNDFRNVVAEEKKEIGQKLNELKQNTQNRINELKEKIENESGSDERDRKSVV